MHIQACGVSAGRRTSVLIRCAISSLAFLVKVNARIVFGRTSLELISHAIRRPSTRVLPDPAPAAMSMGIPAEWRGTGHISEDTFRRTCLAPQQLIALQLGTMGRTQMCLQERSLRRAGRHRAARASARAPERLAHVPGWGSPATFPLHSSEEGQTRPWYAPAPPARM